MCFTLRAGNNIMALNAIKTERNIDIYRLLTELLLNLYVSAVQ